MAQLMQAFNPAEIDPTQGVGGFPVGKHPVVIVSDEIKATKDNSGGMLQFNCEIIDGPAKGTVGAYRLNLYNSNAQAAEIARKQLSAVCHVVGVFHLGPNGDDTSVLHNIPFVIEVAPQKNDPQYTEIKRVFDMNGNEPGKAPQGNGAAQPAQQQQPVQQQQQQTQQTQQTQQGSGQSWGNNQPNNQPAQGGGGGGTQWGGGGGQPAQQTQQPQQQQGGAPAGGGAAWAQNGNNGGGNPNGGNAQPSWGNRG